MKFGRTDNFAATDFTLPPVHPGSLKVLGEQKAKQVKVHVGCPIWADEGFVGKIYPASAKPGNYVKYYGRQFNSIELNISHYKQLDPLTIQRWVELTPGDFKFCPKVHQAISHTPYLYHNIDFMKEFLQTQQHFKQKLGMPFLQLPPNYDSSKLNDLLNFLDQVAMSHFAVELRHESWFNNEAVLKQVCNYFYKNKLTLLMTDTPGRRDVLHQRLTTKNAFIRFLANDLHPTDYIRMTEWVKRLDTWIENGLEEIYFFMHTPNHSLMPELVIFFLKELAKQTGIKLDPPKIMNPETPVQKLF